MDDYFALVGVPPEQQVPLAGTYLKDQAAIWYLTFKSKWGPDTHPTWGNFCHALQAAFSPPNHINNIMDQWAKVHQTTSVHDYAQRFQSILLQPPPNATTPFATLDHFIRGLKPKTQLEVRLRDPSSLQEAIQLADRFDLAYMPPKATTHLQWPTNPPKAEPMEPDTIATHTLAPIWTHPSLALLRSRSCSSKELAFDAGSLVT